MDPALSIRSRAEAEAARLPTLLAHAEHLASTVLLGEHGRRRAGLGDDFWQYRAMQAGDSRRMIDWRRSARSDTQFVREQEWQIAQSVQFWVDQSASMRFQSAGDLPTKIDRARVLALASAVLLSRSGERIGSTDGGLPPRTGSQQLARMADVLITDDEQDYAAPDTRGMLNYSRAVFISDYLSNLEPIKTAVAEATDRGIRGVLLQILDPAEEAFPYRGRTIFQSVGGTLSHETMKASDLRDRYLERLAERKAELAALCASTGWRVHCHHTNQSAQSALLWLHRAIEGAPG
ncbi:DUF58 domain-containing protein [Rhodobacteraceae bacterium 10Alg 79]|uniref:DUF58 domain-containing protein n=1 Tax=Rhodalgimonas zhirmunskyi TaxID=2964767 RepID=A0AAJ1X463_9RHOB|nr:DUF58 domain-containing protein [Rhodoalgimonas zhirmunskyi]MDQ2093968.1 DUF58 domain-containing protein [Rhodoalgimonas zhirmunskyi]